MQKNRLDLAGYLANKPEARFLPSGTKVANARLKESYKFQGTDGKQQTHSNWHSLVFYGEIADIALSFEKDDNIHVEGSIQQRKFTPADGTSRTIYEVHAKSCHRIASTRSELVTSSKEVEEQAHVDNDPSWPVGPV